MFQHCWSVLYWRTRCSFQDNPLEDLGPHLPSQGLSEVLFGTQPTPFTVIPPPSCPRNRRLHFMLPGRRKRVSLSSLLSKQSAEEANLWCASVPTAVHSLPRLLCCFSTVPEQVYVCAESLFSAPDAHDVVLMVERTGFGQLLPILRKLLSQLLFPLRTWKSFCIHPKGIC